VARVRRFIGRHWRTGSGVLAGLLVVLALAQGHQALGEAQAAARKAKVTADALAEVVYQNQVNEYLRANSACASSQALRALLNDLGVIVVPKAQLDDPSIPESKKAVARAFLARIHAYTDSNPNCAHLPIKPKGY
jgi:hypothetical protein